MVSQFQRDDGTLAHVAEHANNLGSTVLAGPTPQRNFSITNHSLHVNTYEIHTGILQHVVHEQSNAAFIDSCMAMAWRVSDASWQITTHRQ